MEHVMQRSTSQSPILDLNRWKRQLPKLKADYQREDPFPHIVLENFLEQVAAEKAYALFPKVRDEGWIHYVHVNEKKHGLNKLDLLPDFLQEVIKTLNSPESVAFISELTGIPNLKADEMLEGGGLHQSQRGGYLNIHADFTVHPHKRKWRRRVNLLIYLNPEWEAGYKGELELWSRDMSQCEQKILPLFNRCVLFNTDEDSFHGLPEAIECPPDMTRKSIALYYFTEDEVSPRKRATNYRARPGDGLKSIPIYLDKQLIAIYNSLKGWLGINDDFVSKILHFFHRKKD